MNINKDKITSLVYDAIDEINRMLPDDRKVAKTVATPLFGKEQSLDSLGIVNLIVEIESKIEDDFGISLSIAEDSLWNDSDNPFETVETLVSYIFTQLNG